MRTRAILVLAHRWAGLAITPVVLITALTGSALAVRPIIDAMLAPAFMATPSVGAGLDPLAVRDRAEAAFPRYRFDEVLLDRQAGGWTMPATERADSDRTIEMAFDPDDGHLIATSEDRGGWPRSPRAVMRFVEDLHVRLAIPGEVGTWLFGIAAILWTIDCFIGAALTFPRRRTDFLRNWATAWRVKPNARGFRRHLDLHRAGGLWLWGLLFVFAWSSVWQNLTTQVYQPVMRELGFRFTNFEAMSVRGEGPLNAPNVPFKQAVDIGRRAIARNGVALGYVETGPYRIRFEPNRGVYYYQGRTSRDPGHYPAAAVEVDARTGRAGAVMLSDTTTGDLITNWLGSIHTADVSGEWFRWLITLFGLATSAITVTGLLIWWRKRLARNASAQIRTAPIAKV